MTGGSRSETSRRYAYRSSGRWEVRRAKVHSCCIQTGKTPGRPDEQPDVERSQGEGRSIVTTGTGPVKSILVWSYRCVSANDLAALDRLAETGEAPRDASNTLVNAVGRSIPSRRSPCIRRLESACSATKKSLANQETRYEAGKRIHSTKLHQGCWRGGRCSRDWVISDGPSRGTGLCTRIPTAVGFEFSYTIDFPGNERPCARVAPVFVGKVHNR